MKVTKASEMARVESLAYQEGISEEKFMLNAAKGISKKLIEHIVSKRLPKKMILLAGKGNNAGDGYAAARLLLEKGYDVLAYQLFSLNEVSCLCKKQHLEFIKKGGTAVSVNDVSDVKLEKNSFILDGIFGTGFKGEVKGLILDVIKKTNASKLKIVSIDMPSGLNGDSGEANPIAIKASVTIYLGLAKLGFFINEGPNYIGSLEYVDFGLPQKYKNSAKKEMEYMDIENLKEMLPEMDKKRHKYQAGFVIGIAGSKGMYGAAKLSALAALRSGCGIVKLITQEEVPFAFYELVNIIMDYRETQEILEICDRADSIFLGPGIGRDKKTENFLSEILPKIHKKCVVDADALFYLSQNQYTLLPHECVLTPHKKEMLRLLRKESLKDEELLIETEKYSRDKNVLIVLKGYPTVIFHPQKEPVSILGGDPGLATAGTGDVLTGMIASFAAQKLDLYKASILAAHLHFKAGQIAAKEKTSYSMIASDVINSLPDAFKSIL